MQTVKISTTGPPTWDIALGGFVSDLTHMLSFLSTCVLQHRAFETEGIWYSDGKGAGVYSDSGDMIFSGPALFKNNKGQVKSEERDPPVRFVVCRTSRAFAALMYTFVFSIC